MLCKRLFKIIKQHGVKYQFGSSPGVGCQDGNFTIKMLLHKRHNHNLLSYVAFVDIVKAFDTVNYEIMLRILHRYGVLPKLRPAIRRMYVDLKVVLKIGKIEEEMSQTAVLFLFMVMAFDKSLEKEWNKAGLVQIKLRQLSHSPRDKGRLTNQKRNKFSQGSLLSLFCILYVENGAFTFGSREQLEDGLNLIHSHFTKYGLEMHIGRGTKASKTECVFSTTWITRTTQHYVQHRWRNKVISIRNKESTENRNK